MTPRIYLMGAVASLPDLGVGWRKVAAEAVIAAGGEPVYPPDIGKVAEGRISAEAARRAWASESGSLALRLACLRVLGESDASICLVDGNEGTGTEAESAFAGWIKQPVVYAHSATPASFAAAAAEAVAKAKEAHR